MTTLGFVINIMIIMSIISLIIGIVYSVLIYVKGRKWYKGRFYDSHIFSNTDLIDDVREAMGKD